MESSRSPALQAPLAERQKQDFLSRKSAEKTKVRTGKTKVLTVFPKVLTEFSKVLSVFTNVLTVFGCCFSRQKHVAYEKWLTGETLKTLTVGNLISDSCLCCHCCVVRLTGETLRTSKAVSLQPAQSLIPSSLIQQGYGKAPRRRHAEVLCPATGRKPRRAEPDRARNGQERTGKAAHLRSTFPAAYPAGSTPASTAVHSTSSG